MHLEYDVCVVGGGPGGYASAIKCGQLGLKVYNGDPDHVLNMNRQLYVIATTL